MCRFAHSANLLKLVFVGFIHKVGAPISVP